MGLYQNDLLEMPPASDGMKLSIGVSLVMVFLAILVAPRTMLNGIANVSFLTRLGSKMNPLKKHGSFASDKGILSTIYRIPATDRKRSMPGPAYTFPNGQMIDKFLSAKAKSWEWGEKYGKTYRIWAASIPEVYVCRLLSVI